MYFFTYYPSPVGTLMLAGDEKNLTGLWIEAQKYFGKTLPEDSAQKDDAPVFTAVKEWLDRYFAGEKPAVSELSLAPAGSEFRQNIWKILGA